MTRRSRVWLVVAALFILLNIAGAAFAVARGEWIHAASHIGLMLVAEYLAWRFVLRRAIEY